MEAGHIITSVNADSTLSVADFLGLIKKHLVIVKAIQLKSHKVLSSKRYGLLIDDIFRTIENISCSDWVHTIVQNYNGFRLALP